MIYLDTSMSDIHLTMSLNTWAVKTPSLISIIGRPPQLNKKINSWDQREKFRLTVSEILKRTCLCVHSVHASFMNVLLGSKKLRLLIKAISYWVLYTEKWQMCISRDTVPMETIIQPVCVHILKNMFMQGRWDMVSLGSITLTSLTFVCAKCQPLFGINISCTFLLHCICWIAHCMLL